MKGYILIIGILAIIISALVTLNIFFQQSLQMEIAEQFNKQQLLLSRTIADNIRSYISSVKEEAVELAHELSEDTVMSREKFLARAESELNHKGMVKATVGVVDRQGRILFLKGSERTIGSSLAEIVKESGRIQPEEAGVIGTPSTVTIVSPVKKHEAAVFLSFTTTDIGNRFFTGIKSGMRGYAWMMDDQGNLLFHPTQPDMVGRNLYKTDSSCFRCHKSFEVEKKIIESNQDNYGIYVAPSGEDKVLAYSIAQVGSAKWIVAVSAPYSEVTMSIQRSMKLYSWLIIAIFVTTSIVSGLLIVFYRKQVKAEEIAKHQKELELHAERLEREVAKRTEELSSEKEKLDSIVTAIGSGIVLLDPEGRIKWVNQAMREMAGQDIVGMNCDELCADCTLVGSYVVNDMQTEIMANLFGKNDKFFQMTTAPVKGVDGEVHGYIRLVQDVTEMKKMEEQMMHSEKLASIGRLTAGIAHEIGNPLTSVFSFVQILKEMEEDEFKKESLDTIYFHINRVAEILKQLSGFSKMPTVELKRWNVNNLIQSSLSLIQYDKRAKEITIVRDLFPDMPEVTTDGSQLSQVFVNLILNAVDAMPGGGTLTIRSRLNDGSMTIGFEDTGIGISRENISRIFDPFFTTKEKGTGLGLAVSYSIIKKLNGSLTVESEVNKGTRFRITLPVNGEQ